MNQKYIHIFGLILIMIGFSFIGFLYWAEPRTLAEVTTKGQVVIGTYEINKLKFESGVASFRREEYPAARADLEQADPERRDANTQFYIAYSYYRQGWGRISNDDDLFTQGSAAATRLISIDPNYRTTDAALTIKTAAELKYEFDEGLKITPSDFNPMKLIRERK